MKIKKIAALCRSTQSILIWDQEKAGEQWIGNGAAMYPLVGMPALDENTVPRIFDLTEKQADKMTIRREAVPEKYPVADVIPGENLVESVGMDLVFRECRLRPPKTSQGLVLINVKYLEPIPTADKLELYERVTPEGGMLIGAKHGMALYGLIAPMNILDEKFLEKVRELLANGELALSSRQDRKS